MKTTVGLFLVFACSVALASQHEQRTLTFEDRVTAQEAIERIYYAHQLGATKTFDDAVPKVVLERKVRKYLEQTAALNIYWKTAVTDQTLQRELERMVEGTRMPERLHELFAALGNDPFLVKECLARLALVDRLTRDFYAFDPTLHAKERAEADALHAQLVSGELSPSSDNLNRTVSELIVGTTPNATDPGRPAGPFQRRVTRDEFQKRRAGLPAGVGQVSDVEETPEGYAFSVVLSETTSDLHVANYVIPKTVWDAWWAEAHATVRGELVTAVASRNVELPPVRTTNEICAPGDTWDSEVLTGLSGRTSHSAVWTGNLMLVWGGYDGKFYLGTGGRYDPATDNWVPISMSGAPAGRISHSAVWTGNSMVIWGGSNYTSLNTGGNYDPISDSWTPTPAAPAARFGHSTVWTGTEMIVWGGSTFDFDNTGWRYNPATGSWTPTSTTGAPSGRLGHTAVWTGSQMLVWGGYDRSGDLNTGGRYNPTTDSWTTMSIVGAPHERDGHVAVWTGTLMLVWGGFGQPYYLNTGGRYDPASDTWTPTSTVSAPSARYYHSAVWTGRHMVVWGGVDTFSAPLATGGRYDPTTDRWKPTTTTGAPTARESHTAVYSGSLMIVWGGDGDIGPVVYGWGGRYVLGTSVDDDGDGYSACQGDCDDTLASVHPGALEACNGLDDNCDGIVDNGGAAMCDDGNSCTDDSCVPAGGCDHAPNGSCCSLGMSDDFNRTTVGPNWQTCSNVSIVGGALQFYNTSGTPTNCPAAGDNLAQAVLVAPISALRDGAVQFDLDNGGPARANNVFQIGFGGFWAAMQQDTYNDTPCRRSVTLIGPSGPIAQICEIVINAGRYEFSVEGSTIRFRNVVGGTVVDLQAMDTTATAASPLVLAVNEDTTRVDNLVLTTGASCDDGNPCTDDTCDPVTGCEYTNNTVACDDGTVCTTNDVCANGSCVGGPALNCNDDNECTDDSCEQASGCVNATNTTACDDGNACTTGDTCGGGTCHAGVAMNCDDGNPCTDDSCSSDLGCRSVPNGVCEVSPRSQGFWRRLCAGPHPEGSITQADVECVNDSCTFAPVHTIAELCDRLKSSPSNNKCEQAESQLMALMLNHCQNRLTDSAPIISQCTSHTTVGSSRAEADALLCSTTRNQVTCTLAQCESEELNSGYALLTNSLRLARLPDGSLRLTWDPPYGVSELGPPQSYLVRRRAGSEAAYQSVASTPVTWFVDTTAPGAPFFEYEVVPVW